MDSDEVGFEPLTRKWVRGSRLNGQCERLPHIEGQIFLDQSSRRAAAKDFGGIVSLCPAAVLKPRALSDITKVIRFCRDQRISVAMRGRGHSTYGQAQAKDGLIIESGELNEVLELADGYIVVDAGTCWRDVLMTSLLSGQAPPVLTDFLGLSIGGTLSIGGFGGTSSRYGSQADNVLELDVVLTSGKAQTCSPEQNHELFETVLCGLGQCGLIVRAKLALISAPTRVRRYKLYYGQLSDLMEDQARLVETARFDYVEGQIYASPSGGFGYLLEACTFLGREANWIDDLELTRDLKHNRSLNRITELSYLEFAERLDPPISHFRSTGEWHYAHAWLSVLLPSSQARSYVEYVLRSLSPDEIGFSSRVILLYPLRKDRLKRRMLQVPDSKIIFQFSILRATPQTSPDIQHHIASNRAFYEMAQASGGKAYPIGAIPFTKPDWMAQFGETWEELCTLKRRYDPRCILTPGHGIFDWNSLGAEQRA
jgi:FAD/FMN-containing dehydrogenase